MSREINTVVGIAGFCLGIVAASIMAAHEEPPDVRARITITPAAPLRGADATCTRDGYLARWIDGKPVPVFDGDGQRIDCDPVGEP